MPWLQRQVSVGVSIKLWFLLWLLKGLKPTLNCKIYRIPKGSCIPKMLLNLGRKKALRWFLSLLKEGISSKCWINTFQDLIALGKKLFMYLDDLHLISRNVISLVRPYKGRRIKGNLSFRYDGVLLFKILWIWRIRRHKRRSYRVSQPNSSLSFEQLEPCQVPVTASAAWYYEV